MLEGSLGRTNGPRAMGLDLAWVGGDMVGRKRERDGMVPRQSPLNISRCSQGFGQQLRVKL